MSDITLIIGKNGKTGQRVDQLLSLQGMRTRAVSRSSAVTFDWQQPQNWADVMAGCRAAYVTYQPDLAVPEARQAIEHFVNVAAQQGIEHIVLLSGRGEQGAQLAEQELIRSGLDWNIVRASWLAQNFSEGFLHEPVTNGHVALPSSDVPEPFVDADDIAEVVVACLTQPSLVNRLFEVTGPECLTFKQCVDIIASKLDRPVTLMPINASQFIQAMQQQGLPKPMQWLMNELFTVVMDGRNSHLCDGVQQALGRAPTSFAQYVDKAIRQGAWQPSSLAKTTMG